MENTELDQPPLPKSPASKMKTAMGWLLNICLSLFVANAVISLVDDSLQILFGLHVFTLVNTILSMIAFLVALLVYGLIAFFPIIPKRVFLPICLYYVFCMLAIFPASIYGGGDWARRGLQLDWVLSLGQLLVGVGILYLMGVGWKLRWPLLTDKFLMNRRFSWSNLFVFLGANVLILAPGIVIYLLVCAALATSHFTAGFVTLRPHGFDAHVRQYVRDDGKKIELVPMSHIGDESFYRKIAKSFPTNSIVLMEGVTDERNLLTNGISYKRMARSLGLSEQKEDFKPQGKLVRADVDVDQFSTNTIDLLNLVMLFHAKGFNADTVMQLTQYSPTPDMEEQLFDDILSKRNEHLVEKLKSELPNANEIIVPWGAAHMPFISKAILNDGFHLVGTEKYTLIRFHL